MEYVEQMDQPSELSTKSVAIAVWRRKWIVMIVVAAALAATHYITQRQPRLYRATAQMMLLQPAPTTANSPEAQLSSPATESAETQLSLLRSDGMAWRVLAWLKNDAFNKGQTQDRLGMINKNKLWRDFQSIVKFANPENTNIITVTVSHENPEIASELANVICLAFADWKKELAQERVQKIMANLEVRARRAREQMLEDERLQLQHSRSSRMIDIPAEKQALMQNFLAKDAEVETLRQDVISQRERVKRMDQQLKQADQSLRSAPSGVRPNEQIAYLQQELNRLETERARLTVRFASEHPDVKTIDAQILDVKGRLAKAMSDSLDYRRPTVQSLESLYYEFKSAQTLLAFNEAKLRAAMAMRDQLREQLKGLPVPAMQNTRLSREAEISSSLYSSIQATLNAARLNADIAFGNVQLTAYAVTPEAPFQPNVTRNWLLGGAIGLAMALMSALLLDQADRRVRSVREVRRLVSGPVIGALPALKRSQVQMLQRGELLPVATEVYGMARANLAAAMRSHGIQDPWHKRVILVTSALPGEGKSLTSANLARSIARSGRSVILVDADMRRPVQNTLFGTDEPIGLADVLAKRISMEEAVVTSDTSDLWILHSGKPDRNPTELIALPEMAEIVNQLRNEVDVVLIDAPACAVVADALLLAPHADAVLYVISAGHANEELIRETVNYIRTATAKPIVYFVNRSPREAHHPYGKYYSYYSTPEVVVDVTTTENGASPASEGSVSESQPSDVKPEPVGPESGGRT
jgi:capsular exopolysaccharide synthesis family protein